MSNPQPPPGPKAGQAPASTVQPPGTTPSGSAAGPPSSPQGQPSPSAGPASPGAGAPSPSADATAEEKTAPHRLRKMAVKLATQRRRTTAASLVVKRPRQAEVRVPLERSETIIGRDPRCDIVLKEVSASRKHARICRNDGGFFEVTDLGSKNGVIVAHERVERMTLMDGDTFIVGDTAFTVTIGLVVGAEE